MASVSRRARSSSPDGPAPIVVATAPRDIEALRAAHPGAAVVAVAAGTATALAALEAGADTVLRDGTRARELRARLDAVARRGNGAFAAAVVGPLIVDRRGCRAVLDGVELHLAPREFALLAELAASPRRLRTKAELLAICWGPPAPASRTLERHIARLRARLGRRAVMLVTVWGAGYRLDEPD